MRLSTQLGLAFFFLAVLPPAGMTVYSYASSVRAYRGVVQAESDRMAREMRSRLSDATEVLATSIQRMRARPRERPTETSAFEQARQDALATAQQVELRTLVTEVLSSTRTDDGQIAFALDEDGRLYTASPSDQPKLYGLGVARTPAGVAAERIDRNDWVVASRADQPSGVTVGVAGPLDAALREMRGTAVRNLGYGLGMVALAFVGILPLSRRLTRHLDTLTDGVERLGAGETDVQVPVPRGAEELGRLAATFNSMARDLKGHQERLLEQERLHKELEISRRIQEELLPREPARFGLAEAAGLSIPAREVGGDFFNYFSLPSGEAVVLVGDVSGKGVPAAILMANLQATLRARLFHQDDLAALVRQLDEELGARRDAREYVTLFVAVLDGARRSMRYVNAGHNTQLLLRAGGGLEHLESSGRPVGLLPGGGYEERQFTVMAGDTLLLFTDGLLDAEDAAGEAFGMQRLEELVSARPGESVAEILERVDAALRAHRGSTEAGDDATVVALQVTEMTPRR
jgi:serine phosphatase RsbU (regulator of sigma subunit)